MDPAKQPVQLQSVPMTIGSPFSPSLETFVAAPPPLSAFLSALEHELSLSAAASTNTSGGSRGDSLICISSPWIWHRFDAAVPAGTGFLELRQSPGPSRGIGA